jgi:hypothetical protein
MADVSVTVGDVTVITDGKRTRNGTGGATLTAGQFVYLDSGRLKGANNSTLAKSTCVGMLVSPTADGNAATYAYQNGSVVDVGATLTEGTWYCISSTAGNIHPAADLQTGEYISWVGYGNADGNLVLWLINDGEVAS